MVTQLSKEPMCKNIIHIDFIIVVWKYRHTEGENKVLLSKLILEQSTFWYRCMLLDCPILCNYRIQITFFYLLYLASTKKGLNSVIGGVRTHLCVSLNKAMNNIKELKTIHCFVSHIFPLVLYNKSNYYRMSCHDIKLTMFLEMI